MRTHTAVHEPTEATLNGRDWGLWCDCTFKGQEGSIIVLGKHNTALVAPRFELLSGTWWREARDIKWHKKEMPMPRDAHLRVFDYCFEHGEL